jgi:hypothetical protein
MSLAEIEQAVDKLSREELAKLAAYITRQDKLGWDEQIEKDFSPGGKHAAALQRIDAEVSVSKVSSDHVCLANVILNRYGKLTSRT